MHDREPQVYEDEFWDPEQEEGFWTAEAPEHQFARRGSWDTQLGGPVLGLAVSMTAEGDLSSLSDDELLGAIAAAERVAGHNAWAANTLAAEYTRRNLETDDKTGEETLGEFGADDYAQEIRLSGMAAKQNLNRSLILAHLPRCMRLARDGSLNDFRQRIIAEETALLDEVLLARADKLIAQDAPGRTPGSLRALCRKIVFTLDPEQAEERRKKAARGRRVEFWPDQSGNITMAAREMSIAVAAAIRQGLDGWAKIMRKAGIKGSLDNLRHDAAAALLMGRHPVTGQSPAPAPDGGTTTDPWNPWGYTDFEFGKEADPEGTPGSPIVNINLLITPGTLDPKIDAPGWIPGFGHVTGQVARDLITAGTTNPATRWCVTNVDPGTGEAVAHGCARGQHRWPAADTGPRNTGPPGTGPPGVPEFVASLNATMEPIAREHGDDGHREPHHDPSRKLKHLIIARNATCATPGCDAPAVTSDMEHRVPWEQGGETSEFNLDPGHKHCHRLKQSKRWKVIKTGPRETVWIGPSGRERTVRPTRYLVV